MTFNMNAKRREAINFIGLQVFDPESGQHISQPVSFSMSFGDLCVITGPNGVGKSTLLQGIAALISSGRLSNRLKGTAQPNVGYLKSKCLQVRLHPQLSAPMFALPLCLRDVLNWYCPADAELPDLIDDLDLGRAWDSASGGEKQRVLLAGIFAESRGDSPEDLYEILLLDEPGNHLDAKNRQQLLNQVKRWLQESESRSVIVVTHDPETWKPNVLIRLEAVEK